jgi:hypothetical protein
MQKYTILEDRTCTKSVRCPSRDFNAKFLLWRFILVLLIYEH